MILSETNRRVASDMAPLSSSSLSPRPRYDVFLSFYEDVRRTFVSYLIKEFKWLGITAVYSGLVGCEVTSHPEVTEAIKKSRISVVILSKNYVSSSRCLNELVEIITWSKETWGYRVIPVYYEVDPSYVRKQTKTIGKGLVGTFLGKVEKPEVKWRRALTYIVDEVGESSQDWFVLNLLCQCFYYFLFLELLCVSLKHYEIFVVDQKVLLFSSFNCRRFFYCQE